MLEVLGTSKPNVRKLIRRQDVDGLIEAAFYRHVVHSRGGGTADLGAPIRAQAILALGALGPNGDNGTVAAALFDPYDRVRVAAVRVLYSREEPGPIIEALRWLPVAAGSSRQLAIHAVRELSGPGMARAVAGVLIRRIGADPLSDEEISLFLTVVEDDERPGAADDLVADLMGALADPREVVGDRAGELLVYLAPTSTEALIDELRAGRAPHRAASALCAIGDTRALVPLVEALEHRDPRVRIESAAALGELCDPAAVEPLLRATGDPELLVRAQAGAALDRIGTVAVIFGVSALLRPMIEGVAKPVRHLDAMNGASPVKADLRALSDGDFPAGLDPVKLRQLAAFLDRITN
jgi:HEAT repeat protein